VLELRDIKTYFPLSKGALLPRRCGEVRAVDGVSLCIDRGEVLGLVGESGCGKSTLGRSVLRLVNLTAGSIHFEGRDLEKLSPRELRSVRPDLQMVFQDPYATLNPRITVGGAVAEAAAVRSGRFGSAASRSRAAELLSLVGLDSKCMGHYPHEFSGGQRQRIAVARALATGPKLIVADEPVSALDVSVQAQIINLLSDLRRSLGLTMLFISHDLSVVHHIADRIAVMYLGRVVELGPASSVYTAPVHPYSRALIGSIPSPDPHVKTEVSIEGEPPSALHPPPGCAFHPRCPCALPSCALDRPELSPVPGSPSHQVACPVAG
jgi:oligopeptide/dipeptide ABC transporter ATP-binding protein